MANKKITELGSLTTAVSADELAIVDASDTTQGASGSTKRITFTNFYESRGIYAGSGTPEGAIAAPIGSIFLRSDGSTNTTLYVKESTTGNTGWAAK